MLRKGGKFSIGKPMFPKGLRGRSPLTRGLSMRKYTFCYGKIISINTQTASLDSQEIPSFNGVRRFSNQKMIESNDVRKFSSTSSNAVREFLSLSCSDICVNLNNSSVYIDDGKIKNFIDRNKLPDTHLKVIITDDDNIDGSYLSRYVDNHSVNQVVFCLNLKTRGSYLSIKKADSINVEKQKIVTNIGKDDCRKGDFAAGIIRTIEEIGRFAPSSAYGRVASPQCTTIDHKFSGFATRPAADERSDLGSIQNFLNDNEKLHNETSLSINPSHLDSFHCAFKTNNRCKIIVGEDLSEKRKDIENHIVKDPSRDYFVILIGVKTGRTDVVDNFKNFTDAERVRICKAADSCFQYSMWNEGINSIIDTFLEINATKVYANKEHFHTTVVTKQTYVSRTPNIYYSIHSVIYYCAWFILIIFVMYVLCVILEEICKNLEKNPNYYRSGSSSNLLIINNQSAPRSGSWWYNAPASSGSWWSSTPATTTPNVTTSTSSFWGSVETPKTTTSSSWWSNLDNPKTTTSTAWWSEFETPKRPSSSHSSSNWGSSGSGNNWGSSGSGSKWGSSGSGSNWGSSGSGKNSGGGSSTTGGGW